MSFLATTLGIVCAGSGVVHTYCSRRRRAAKLGKKAVFLLLLSVLSFFVEASHILLQLLLFLPP